jgi:hypothetical protein
MRARQLARWRKWAGLVVAGLAAGCHWVGPLETAKDSQADASATGDVRTGARAWIESIRPDRTSIPERPVVRVQFETYLEDESFQSYNAARMTSGELTFGGTADYHMVDRTIAWRPNGPLPTGLRLRFELSASIEGVLGRTFPSALTLRTYRPGESGDTGTEPLDSGNVEPETPDWSDIDVLFEAKCRGCHGADSWNLNPLTYESLVGEPSIRVDRMLVRPYDAPDSYLMHKLLWDYPERRGMPQPPPWSEAGEELPEAELRAIERWIEAGAPRASE